MNGLVLWGSKPLPEPTLTKLNDAVSTGHNEGVKVGVHWLSHFPRGAPWGLNRAHGTQIFGIQFVSENTGLIFAFMIYKRPYGDIQHQVFILPPLLLEYVDSFIQSRSRAC